MGSRGLSSEEFGRREGGGLSEVYAVVVSKVWKSSCAVENAEMWPRS